MPLGVQYSGIWTLAQQFQAVGAVTWKNITLNELYTFGYNAQGQLGDNTRAHRSSPTQVGALITWSNIAGGGVHTIATKTDGTLWTWGRNSEGQLGDNTDEKRSSPIQVGALTTWSLVACGNYHNIAIESEPF